MLKDLRNDVDGKVEQKDFNIILFENAEIKKNAGNFVSNNEMRKRLE